MYNEEEKVLIDKNFYDEICEIIDKLTKICVEKKIYSNEDVRELLSVNDKLVRKYRDDGLLSYSRVGNKYFYSSDDIRDFLDKTHLRNY